MRRTPRADAAAAAGVALAALIAWAGWVEPRRLVVRERTLRLPQWPHRLDGLRVALLADFHAGAPQVDERAVARVVRRTNARRPDLICVLGDIIDPDNVGGQELAPEAVAAELAALRAPLGVLAVLGNHDWGNNAPRIAAALRAAGLTVLENEAVARRFRDEPLYIGGLADLSMRDPDLGRALADVPTEAPVLLLSHDPDVFPSVPRRVALTVSGHTHGGQVDLPLLRRRAIPSRFGERYARGHIVEDGRHLFVTSGVGTSRLPIRLGRPPEIVVLRLCAGPAGDAGGRPA